MASSTSITVTYKRLKDIKQQLLEVHTTKGIIPGVGQYNDILRIFIHSSTLGGFPVVQTEYVRI